MRQAEVLNSAKKNILSANDKALALKFNKAVQTLSDELQSLTIVIETMGQTATDEDGKPTGFDIDSLVVETDEPETETEAEPENTE